MNKTLEQIKLFDIRKLLQDSLDALSITISL